MSTSRKIGRYTVTITHPDKLIFPQTGIYKEEFVNYYARAAKLMLAYMRNRPLTMHRFVEGIDGADFYQKDASDYFPPWITTINIPRSDGKPVNYVVCDKAATLVYLANQLCITPHLWLSTTDALEYPDRMIFDLDPGPQVEFASIRAAAYMLGELLADKGLLPFVMTTGSRGVHVVVPIKQNYPFDTVRAFARDCAAQLVAQYPRFLTLEVSKGQRIGKVFIDTLRNSFGATAVAPYAVRAKEGAPVATPINWRELARVTPQQYTIRTIWRRLARIEDPWRDFFKRVSLLP